MADHNEEGSSNERSNQAVATITSRLPLLKKMKGLSDLKIICNGKKWRVHKAVFVMHSSLLDKAHPEDLKVSVLLRGDGRNASDNDPEYNA